MIAGTWADPRRISPRVLLLGGLVGVALLVASLLVEVRVVVTSPDLGDVTGVLRTLWRTLLAIATLGSFLLAVRNARDDGTSSDSPARTFEIKGENHDIDVHLHGIDPTGDGARTDRADGSTADGSERRTTDDAERDGEKREGRRDLDEERGDGTD
ncbi:hypothetical protein [Halosimplex halobium]|uniref:hypothetical protein n=1 Tax=Halosimplex halobium TaxID=3396618 RepID=UPI003F549432